MKVKGSSGLLKILEMSEIRDDRNHPISKSSRAVYVSATLSNTIYMKSLRPVWFSDRN